MKHTLAIWSSTYTNIFAGQCCICTG